ncbi:hypothetical protein EZ313_06590 [Ramlibacter henchirensis]|uniref:Uncharacterized protein n=1 Tax=Ramlibacter henchirensis TaxID=204072 RepID=A0A4Z0C7E0_9BURK|nr:hypothetical protein EZ313_06590 [Ramlibacter henchirensis]
MSSRSRRPSWQAPAVGERCDGASHQRSSEPRHSRAGGNPGLPGQRACARIWIPACAGMTALWFRRVAPPSVPSS